MVAVPIYSNDEAYCVAVYYKPRHLLLWDKGDVPWERMEVWGDTRSSVVTRKDGVFRMKVEEGLSKEYLYAYLFFKWEGGKYSRTYSTRVE